MVVITRNRLKGGGDKPDTALSVSTTVSTVASPALTPTTVLPSSVGVIGALRSKLDAAVADKDVALLKGVVVEYCDACVGNKSVADDVFTNDLISELWRMKEKFNAAQIEAIGRAFHGLLQCQSLPERGLMLLVQTVWYWTQRSSEGILVNLLSSLHSKTNIFDLTDLTSADTTISGDVVARVLVSLTASSSPPTSGVEEVLPRLLVGGVEKFQTTLIQSLIQLMKDPFTCAPSLAVIQLIVLTGVREIIAGRSTPSHFAAIQVLGADLHSLPAFGQGGLLPCILTTCVVPPTITACTSPGCLEGIPDPLPDISLADTLWLTQLNIFQCSVCTQFFSLSCVHCSSCPIDVGGNRTCWGCGYRCIAASVVAGESEKSAVMKSTDEKLVAALLCVAAALPHESWNVDFLCRTFSKLIPHFPTTLSSSQGAPPVISSTSMISSLPSPQFVLTLLGGLFVNDRISQIRKNLVSILIFASSNIASTHHAMKALTAFIPTTKADSLRGTILTHSLSVLVAGVKQKPDRTVKAVLNAIDAAIAEGVGDLGEVGFALIEAMSASVGSLSLSCKRHIFKIIVSTVLPLLTCEDSKPLISALVDYLTLTETENVAPLLETLAELVSNTKTAVVVSWFISEVECNAILRPLLVGNQPGLAVLLKRSIEGLHEGEVDEEVNVRGIGFLLENMQHSEYFKEESMHIAVTGILIPTLVDLFHESSPTAKQTVITCISHLPRSLINSTLLELIQSHLLPLLWTGNSVVVRAVCRLIGTTGECEFIEKLISKFSPDTGGVTLVRSCWVIGSLIQFAADTLSSSVQDEAVTALLDLIFSCDGKSDPSLISVVGFVGASSRTNRDRVMNDSRFLEFVSSALTNNDDDRARQLKVLEMLVHVMEAAVVTAATGIHQVADPSISLRPEGGVECRAIGKFSVPIRSLILSPYRATSLGAMRAIELMDVLGIVNRRLLPSDLLVRYIVSSPTPEDGCDAEDTSEVNMRAYHLCVRFLEPKLKHGAVVSAFAGLEERFRPLGDGSVVVNAICRFVRLLSSGSILSPKADLKHVLDSLLSHLGVERDEGMIFFVVAVVLCLSDLLVDETLKIQQQLHSTGGGNSDDASSYPLKFLLHHMGRINREGSSFDRTFFVNSFKQFQAKEVLEEVVGGDQVREEAVVVKARVKRVRESTKDVVRVKKIRRKSVAELAEGSSDDEYVQSFSSDEESGIE